MPTLYEQLGGRETINAAVDIFYEKVLGDAHINHFFKSVDMHKQRGIFKVFFAFAFGAPLNYSGRDLRSAHNHLKLDDSHFTVARDHLIASFKQLGIGDELLIKVKAVVESTRNDVLNR